MKVFSSPHSFQKWRSSVSNKETIGFVPTMGALHRGHISLIKRSVGQNDLTVVSIFVNPLQFGPNEDFSKYPRPRAHDLAQLRSAGVKLVLAPTPHSMYPYNDSQSRISVEGLTQRLCGSPQSRGPDHFRGVATVVAKLFNIVRPTRAYFGMKDFQQLRVIEKMNSDLNFNIHIVRCPTVREADGLALSSRNAYLSPAERSVAPRFYLALQQGAKLLRSRARMNPQVVCQKVKGALVASIPEFKIDYIDVVSAVSLQARSITERPVLLAGAVWLGKTRLIDNILVN